MSSEITPTTVTLPALPTAEDVRELLTSALPYMTNPVSIERVTSFLVTGTISISFASPYRPADEPLLDDAARDVAHWSQWAFKPDNPISTRMLPSAFNRLRELVHMAKYPES